MSLPRGVRRHISSLWNSLCRLKTDPSHSNTSRTPHSADTSGNIGSTEFVLDLVCTGLGSSLTIGALIIAGTASGHIAGPSATLAVCLAAVAAALNALCYTELRSRCRSEHGCSYTYMYRTCGEGIAAFVGWSTLLRHTVATAAVARSISHNLDIVVNKHITNLTAEHFGQLPLFGSYPDFLAPVFVLCVTSLFAIGIQSRKLIVNLLNAAVMVLVLFSLVVGTFQLDFSRWSDAQKFFPIGAFGVFEAATCFFYAFSIIEYVSVKVSYNVTDEDSPRLSKHLALSLFLCFAIFVMIFGPISASVSLLTSATISEVPYAEALIQTGYTWMRYILCPCAMIMLTVCMMTTYSQLLSIVSELAEDGLLLSILYDEVRPLKASRSCILLASMLASVYAILFNIQTLLLLAGVLCLLTFTMTCMCSLTLRYQPYLMQPSPRHRTRKLTSISPSSSLPPGNCYGTTGASHSKRSQQTDQNENAYGHVSHVDDMDTIHFETSGWYSEEDSDTDIDDAVEEYREELRLIAFTNCSLTGGASEHGPTDQTNRCAKICTVAITVWTLCLLATLTYGAAMIRDGSPLVIAMMCLFLLCFMLTLFMLLRQPVESAILQDVAFHVRPTPWVQLLVLFLNVQLLMSVSMDIWIHCACWYAIGISVYFCYGMRHSTSARLYSLLSTEESNLLPETFSACTTDTAAGYSESWSNARDDGDVAIVTDP